MTESLGGLFESALTLDTTFLIADRTEGDKYRVRVIFTTPLTFLDKERKGS
jgi:hypothetical protein